MREKSKIRRSIHSDINSWIHKHRFLFLLSPNPSPNSMSNFATYGDALLCKPHYHQLFQVKGNYTELARHQRYAISGSTERLIQAGEITEDEAKQMMLIQAEVDNMVEGTV